MSEPTPQPVPAEPVKPTVSWRHLWQIPAALAGTALAISAVVYSVKTTPRADHGNGLVEASAELDAGRYEDALGVLNAQVLPYMADGTLTRDQQKKFFLLRARAIYLGQRELGINREENHKNIIEEYKTASSQGAELTPQDDVYRCDTLVSLGEFDEAFELLHKLPDEVRDARLAIRKRLIDAALDGGPGRADAAIELIADFTKEPNLSDADRLWALGRQSRLLLAAKMPEEAITRILRAMPRLEDAATPAVGEVLVTLAQAYLDLDQVQRAGAQLERASELLGEAHELSPKVARMLAVVDQTIGGENLTRSKERFERLIETWPHSTEVPRAMLGLAEVESVLGNTQSPGMIAQSLKHYGQLVSMLRGEEVDLGGSHETTETGGAGEAVSSATPDAHGESEAGEAKQAAAGTTQAGHGAPAATDAPAAAPADAGLAAKEVKHGSEVHGAQAKAADTHGSAGQGEHGSAPHGEQGSEPEKKPKVGDEQLADDTLRSVLSRFVEQFENKDYHAALGFAEAGRRLTGVDDAPAELLLGLARTHRELAGELLESAAGGSGALTLAQVDPATQREAREHLMRAGEYYRLHAARSVQTDSKGYGDSLWAAADMFDRAGDLSSSASAFQQFAADFPGDSRKATALFRLAEAQRAGGDMESAARIYRELIAGRASSRESGPIADESYVPLAITLLGDHKTENDAEAEEHLLRVVRGEVGGTATPMFRQALQTLGEYYYDSGQFERAIERLDEYIERERLDTRGRAQAPSANGNGAVAEQSQSRPIVGDSSQLLGLFYKLADAYRQSAIKIGEGFAAAMPDSQRSELERARHDRLEQAQSLFDGIQRAYDKQKRRTALEDLRLRNATFFKADCAFDLGDFDTAVRLYDAAKERYPRDAVSLVAMVQIVSALLEQGRTAEAATANVRARRFYESLPETAWDDPTLPMSRAQWEQWLDAQSKLAGASESGGPSN
ncbi:MAG: tetratricopeptide repeat protein [Planctomycetota bacterium]|nr:tetratricopeptide repeat protein [Planctomycetota bacterium]